MESLNLNELQHIMITMNSAYPHCTDCAAIRKKLERMIKDLHKEMENVDSNDKNSETAG